MTHRVLLLAPALSASHREARFDDGSGLDPAGVRAAREAASGVPGAEQVWCSPSARCRETARVLGLDAVEVAAWGGLDVGRWRGETLADVGAREPEAVAAWLADPGAAPHGGESVRALCDRVERWLRECADLSGRTVAVVEPEVVRAVVVRVLGAPEGAFWRVDVAPLAGVEISGRGGRWNLRVG
ncbi:histidine phosphatase family protein [Streptomyces roseirectus]|uniref:Histidine phosphatase family protein n=1 Tax=Streptomyces roseirectus TaxID=2768066 RepID=A0A7H0I6X5_9ACTN|nr:histidine phosphatase family protein [Streptomyces roseirectus]QNP68541.1 histidine phosphatase family protein [Streptomyces roseirectus]